MRKWLTILSCVYVLNLFGCSNETDIFDEQQIVINDIHNLIEILNNKTTFPIKGARNINYMYNNDTEDIIISFDLDANNKYFENVEMIEKSRDVIINDVLMIEQNQLDLTHENFFMVINLYDDNSYYGHITLSSNDRISISEYKLD